MVEIGLIVFEKFVYKICVKNRRNKGFLNMNKWYLVDIIKYILLIIESYYFFCVIVYFLCDCFLDLYFFFLYMYYREEFLLMKKMLEIINIGICFIIYIN